MERIFVQGNEAIGWGALMAGCEAFFGYPITPQNEITEWFAREFPKRGRVFLQVPSEVSAINMLFGAGACGVRAMTSTSGPGWALMQETMSYLSAGEIPCVIALVQRGGLPGEANVRHGQSCYFSATRGGGHGGYRNIVLAPSSVQENHDFIQLAFHLADKHRTPVVLLTDAIIGQMAEILEVKTLDFPPLPPKDWAVGGKGRRKDKERRLILQGPGVMGVPPHTTWGKFAENYKKKLDEMKKEVRWEEYEVEDAEAIVVAYGYCARVSKAAVKRARKEGLKAGLIRPITLWPFPYEAIKRREGARFIVVEDCLGQMVEDVKMCVKDDVRFVGILDRHLPTVAGMIMPERVLREIREALG